MTRRRLLGILQKVVFSVLIFLIPTQLALHLWPSWAHVYGIRVDYLAPTFYLTDVLLGTLVLLWFSDVYALNRLQGLAKLLRRKKTWAVGFAVFFIFIFINILVAGTPVVTVFKWAKVAELFLFGAFVVKKRSLDSGDWIAKPLTLSLILFSLIAIFQFVFQRTLGGPLYFLGERSFDVSTPGIALLDFAGRQFLRPYSTFPHPNSLAGFLVVASLLIIGLKERGRCGKDFATLSLVFSAIALILSASLGAYLAVAIVAIYYIIYLKKKRLFKKALLALFLLSVVVSIVLPVVGSGARDKSEQLSEDVFYRLSLAEASAKMFLDKPLTGIGLNNFVIELPKRQLEPKVSWWLQPVHNIFLLALSETGALGLFVFVFVFWKALEKTAKGVVTKRRMIALALLAIIVTGSLDHYWLTLQQNQLILSLALGLSFKKGLEN